MRRYAVIMAGGSGTRFWPKSRKSHPKQFLPIVGDKSLIRQTLERLRSLVESRDIYIVINRNHLELTRQELPEIPESNILIEPASKNTAACIALAAFYISRKDPEGTMLVLPSDHSILDKKTYTAKTNLAFKVAEAGENLVTFGIVPEHAETGYGYIEMGEVSYPDIGDGILKVKCFKEKPDKDTAWVYSSSGLYLWNSGMFSWSIRNILSQFEKHLPQTFESLKPIADMNITEIPRYLETVYPNLTSISIDHGIMEKADNVYVIKGDFGWSDVGSWRALGKMIRPDKNGNAVDGDVVTIESDNNIVIGNKRTIALIHVCDMVIVDTDEAILICPREKTQDVKFIIDELKKGGRDDLI